MARISVNQFGVFIPTLLRATSRKISSLAFAFKRAVFRSPLSHPIGWLSMKFYRYDNAFFDLASAIRKGRVFAAKYMMGVPGKISWQRAFQSAMENNSTLIVDALLLQAQKDKSLTKQVFNRIKEVISSNEVKTNTVFHAFRHSFFRNITTLQGIEIVLTLLNRQQSDQHTVDMLKTLVKNSSHNLFTSANIYHLLTEVIRNHQLGVLQYLLSLSVVSEKLKEDFLQDRVLDVFFDSLSSPNIPERNIETMELFSRLLGIPGVADRVKDKLINRLHECTQADGANDHLINLSGKVGISSQQWLEILNHTLANRKFDLFLRLKDEAHVQEAISTDIQGTLLVSLLFPGGIQAGYLTREMRIRFQNHKRVFEHLLNVESIKQSAGHDSNRLLKRAIELRTPDLVEKLASCQSVRSVFLRSINIPDERQDTVLVKVASSDAIESPILIRQLVSGLAADEQSPGFRETALLALEAAEGSNRNIRALRQNIRCVDEILTQREEAQRQAELEAQRQAAQRQVELEAARQQAQMRLQDHYQQFFNVHQIFDAVRDAGGRVLRPRRDRELQDWANDPEGAMRGARNLSGDIQNTYRRIQEAYQVHYDSLGDGHAGFWGGAQGRQAQEAILHQIECFIREEYEKDPATYRGKVLPLEYDPAIYKNENGEDKSRREIKAINTTYHSHQLHTAYRYLIAKPNHWMARRAVNVVRMDDGSGAHSRISDDSKEKICFLWLAACFEPLPENTDRHDVKMNFIGMLQDRGRSNNSTTREEGDKPDCDLGVGTSISQFLMMLLGDEAVLDPSILSARFDSYFVSSNEKQTGIIDRINALNIDELQSFDKILEKVVILLEDIEDKEEFSDEQRALFARVIDLDDADVNAFKTQCLQAYGNKMRQEISHRGDKYPDYDAFIDSMVASIHKSSYGPISVTVKNRLENASKQSEQSEQSKGAQQPSLANKENESQPITPLRNLKRRSSRLLKRAEGSREQNQKKMRSRIS